MPPDERRAAIIEVAAALVEQEGIRVSTKKIADAAGIAEGTLFRVFPTKAELIKEVVTQAMDPADVLAHLAEIDDALPIDDRIAQVIVILQGSIQKIRSLMMVMRQTMAEFGHDGTRWQQMGRGVFAREGAADEPGMTAHSQWHHPGSVMPPHGPDAWLRQNEVLRQGVERVLASGGEELAVDQSTAASFILVLAFASTFPGLVSPQPDTPTLTALIVRALTVSQGKETR